MVKLQSEWGRGESAKWHSVLKLWIVAAGLMTVAAQVRRRNSQFSLITYQIVSLNLGKIAEIHVLTNWSIFEKGVELSFVWQWNKRLVWKCRCWFRRGWWRGGVYSLFLLLGRGTLEIYRINLNKLIFNLKNTHINIEVKWMLLKSLTLHPDTSFGNSLLVPWPTSRWGTNRSRYADYIKHGTVFWYINKNYGLLNRICACDEDIAVNLKNHGCFCISLITGKSMNKEMLCRQRIRLWGEINTSLQNTCLFPMDISTWLLQFQVHFLKCCQIKCLFMKYYKTYPKIEL